MTKHTFFAWIFWVGLFSAFAWADGNRPQESCPPSYEETEGIGARRCRVVGREQGKWSGEMESFIERRQAKCVLTCTCAGDYSFIATPYYTEACPWSSQKKAQKFVPAQLEKPDAQKLCAGFSDLDPRSPENIYLPKFFSLKKIPLPHDEKTAESVCLSQLTQKGNNEACAKHCQTQSFPIQGILDVGCCVRK